MIARILLSASAAITLFLGAVHLKYTALHTRSTRLRDNWRQP